jgi:hypothetical protein
MSALSKVAVREGFEPSIQLPVCILSRDVVSATHPSHRNDTNNTKEMTVTQVKSSIFYKNNEQLITF